MNPRTRGKLYNRFAQVGTGEGKSVILAFLSSFLALLGYEISCACYSEYLSERDGANFAELFSVLGVERLVKYGTFNHLCKQMLTAPTGSVAEKIYKIATSNTPLSDGVCRKEFEDWSIFKPSTGDVKKERKIMIIDELDVFFQKNFFGMTYDPSISLEGQAIQTLICAVWQQAKTQRDRIKAKSIFEMNEFRQLAQEYPLIEGLLKNQVHGMIDGALNYRHDYHIHDAKIMYKDADTYTDKISYGYKTVFAYCHEYDNNKVSMENMNWALKIQLRVSEFSYAMLPTFYQCLLGVTGTLEVIPEFKKEILRKRYDIREEFLIPSAFGLNKKRKEEYHIVRKSDYSDKIFECISKVDPDRPVIIFFSSIDELNQFFTSEEYQQKGDKKAIALTELHDAFSRKKRIESATLVRQRTLMTDAFGRGTDFIVLNKEIDKKGGVHVIRTFLSLDESEEVQIKGRTARQNNEGSYEAIICEDVL